MDQTGFIQNQENLQKPPEEMPLPLEEQPVVDPGKQKKKLLIFAGLGGVLVLLLVLSYTAKVVTNKLSEPTPTPPPVVLPTNAPRAQTEFGKQLESVEEQINQADPSEIELDPPPLNYKIRL